MTSAVHKLPLTDSELEDLKLLLVAAAEAFDLLAKDLIAVNSMDNGRPVMNMQGWNKHVYPDLLAQNFSVLPGALDKCIAGTVLSHDELVILQRLPKMIEVTNANFMGLCVASMNQMVPPAFSAPAVEKVGEIALKINSLHQSGMAEKLAEYANTLEAAALSDIPRDGWKIWDIAGENKRGEMLAALAFEASDSHSAGQLRDNLSMLGVPVMHSMLHGGEDTLIIADRKHLLEKSGIKPEFATRPSKTDKEASR